ncbi:hypothetical protein ES703_00818 [subsurface metagenome]
MVKLGRPRKFEDPTVASIKGEKAVIEAARAKAEADGSNLNEITNDFWAAYAVPDSPHDKLRAEVEEQRRLVHSEEIKLAALELRLSQKTQDIPESYISYWVRKRRKMNQDERLQFLETSAKKLKISRDELGKRLDKLADELVKELGRKAG